MTLTGARSVAVAAARSPTFWAIALIGSQFLLRWPGTRDSWFYADDLLFLSDIASGRDDFGWFFRNHQGHIMPGSFLLVEMIARVGAYPWAAAAIQIAVLQAVAAGSIWIMLRVLFGRKLHLLVPFVVFLFASASVPATTWWAVAVNQLPFQIAFGLTVAAHVLWMRTRKPVWLAAATLGLLLGFTVYTKTILVPLVLLFITVTYFTDGPRRLRRSLRRDWPAWMLQGAVSASWLALYLGVPDTNAPFTFNWQLFEVIRDHLMLAVVPTFLGGPINWVAWVEPPITIAAPPTALIVASWVLFCAFVLGVWMRRRTAVIGLVPAVAYALLSLVIMIISRSVLVEIGGAAYLARQLQYLADLAPVIALSLALMLHPLIGAAQFSRARTPPLLLLPGSRRTRIVGWTVGAVALLAAAVASNLTFVENWRDPWPQRTFFTTAMSEVTRTHPVIADSTVPDTAINPLFADHRRIERAMSPLADRFTLSDSGTTLQIFTDDGHLAPAKVDAGDRLIDSGIPCHIVTSTGTLLPVVPTFDYPLWTAVDIEATTPTTAVFQFGPRRFVATIEPGSHTFLAATPQGYSGAWIRSEGTNFCVTALRVGPLIAGAAS